MRVRGRCIRAAGGVFRSENGGRDWKEIGLGGHSVRALVQSAASPDVLIAGAVDGVFRSRDAGKNWERISPENHEDLRNFDSIALDPKDADTIYAGTFHLAWKTTDGGRNWSPVQKGMVDDSDVMSITIDTGNPLHVFSSACSGIYHSSDGGASWMKFKGIPSTSRRTVQIKQDPQHPEIVYAATTEGLWRTVDDGASWKPITPVSWSVLSMLIDPVNPQRLILGTERMGVEISEDGGATYHQSNQGFSHRRIADMAIDPAKPGHALVVLTNAIEPLLETSDAGQSWQSLSTTTKDWSAARRVCRTERLVGRSFERRTGSLRGRSVVARGANRRDSRACESGGDESCDETEWRSQRCGQHG